MTKSPLLLSVLLFAGAPLFADTSLAYAALQYGRVGEAEKVLRNDLQSAPNDPRAHELLCRVFYAQDEPDRAVPECEAAAAAAPNDSETQLWLGRAYGQKAERANPLSAYTLARKLRIAFEAAAQVKPTNIEAVSSLGQFYISAPSIVGGGLDKARRLAETLRTQSPAKAHRLLAFAANSAKDLKTAESEFKLAIGADPSPDAYMDLALFYQMHHRPDEALAAVRAGISADRAHSPALVDAASILHDANRAPELAEQALRDYIDSSAQADSAPVFKARLQLGRLLAQRGDHAAARQQFAAAIALAPGYSPARDAMKGG